MDFISTFTSFGHDDAQNHYQDIYNRPQSDPHHHGSLGHEAIAGAAGFAAMKAYESHLRASGQEPSHALMKEILAGIAAAEVDKLVETKGLDYVDRHKAKKLAEKQAHELADQRYGGGTGFEYVQAQGPEWGMPGHHSHTPLPQGYFPPPFPPPQQFTPYGAQPGYAPVYQQGYPGEYAAPPPVVYQEVFYEGAPEGRHNHDHHHHRR
jgi:hypothetical protein